MILKLLFSLGKYVSHAPYPRSRYRCWKLTTIEVSIIFLLFWHSAHKNMGWKSWGKADVILLGPNWNFILAILIKCQAQRREVCPCKACILSNYRRSSSWVKETEGDRLAEHILNSLCPLNCDPFEDPVINTQQTTQKRRFTTSNQYTVVADSLWSSCRRTPFEMT